MPGHRDWSPASDDHQPVTWVQGYPVYAAHFIVGVFVVLMIVTAFLGGGANQLFGWLAFNSAQVWSGQVWRLFTYGLFNPPSLGFALDMVMLVWFGRELEKSLGRRAFFQLYGGIYLAPAVVLTLIGLFRPMAYFGQPGSLALFVGFATLFPGAMMIFNILAQWAAIVLVGIFALMAIAERNWNALILLAATCGYAHLFIRVQQGTLPIPRLRWPRRQPRLHVLPDPEPRRKSAPLPAPPPDATMAEIDALLDKIAASGIGSLTSAERARLESARDELKRRQASSR